jgi:glycosyltransferase involved in cell wall biosynthesis
VVEGEAISMIGIIVPVYNGARYLKATLQSVVAQSHAQWRLLIVDDGSTDDSTSIAESFAHDDRVRVIRQPNAGVSAARNRGFAELGADITHVVFLDADDVWEPDALQTLWTAALQSPYAPAVYGLARAITADGLVVDDQSLERFQRDRRGVTPRGLVLRGPDEPTDFAVEVYHDVIATLGTVLFRRAALQQSGLFDTTLRCWEDWDLFLRICLIGPMMFHDRLVLGKRGHDTNLSGDQGAMIDGARRVRRKLTEALRHDRERSSLALLGQRFMHRSNAAQHFSLARRHLLERRAAVGIRHAARALACSLKDVVLGIGGGLTIVGCISMTRRS